MNGKIIGGIVCIVIGVLIGILFINDSSKDSTREELLNSVAFIEDSSQIDEANEGKAIIVTGHPELKQDAVDTKNDIRVKAPYLKRIDEVYKWEHCDKKHRTADEDYCMQWHNAGTEEFQTDAQIGSYIIPYTTLLSLSMPQKSLPLTQEDATRLKMKIDHDGDQQYFATATGLHRAYVRDRDLEGAKRTSYLYKDLSGFDTITVLGIQDKGAIVTNDFLSAHSFDRAMSRDEVIAAYKDEQAQGFLVGMIAMVIFILIGGALVFWGKKIG